MSNYSFVKKINEIPEDVISVGEKTYKQTLISSSDAPNFAMRKFTIKPGGFMPLHTNSVEHEQYVIKGRAEVQIGDKKLIVEQNDVVYIPAGVEHNYKTIGNENFEFICMIPNIKDEIKLV